MIRHGLLVSVLLAGALGACPSNGLGPDHYPDRLRADPGDPSPEAPLRASVRLSPAEVTVGDPLEAVLTVRFAPGWVVETPAIGPVHGGFRVGAVPGPERLPAPGGGGAALYRIPAAVYRPGSQTFPPVTVRAVRPGAAEGYSATTAPVEMTVRSVLSGPDREIAGIKGPADLPAGWSPLWWLLAAPAAAAAAIWAWRRRKARAAPARTEPEPPAHEWALVRLHALAASDLLARGGPKRFIIELAGILKGFLQRRFRIVTLERTTEEVLEALRFARAGPQATEAVRDLLARCDLVKFARHRPREAEAAGLVEAVRRLVEANREPEIREPADSRRTAAGGGAP